MSKGTVLIILSAANTFVVEKSDGTLKDEKTGFFLSELATPLEIILDAGFEVEFASPGGRPPSIDPLSTSLPLAYMGNYWRKKHEEALIAKMERDKHHMLQPKPFSAISDEEVPRYKGVLIPGGHAPLTDLGDDPELGRILWAVHRNGSPTAVICHGPYALLSTKFAPGAGGRFAYEGYKIASWSDASESLIEMVKGGVVPNKVESSLSDAGADMEEGWRKAAGSVTEDRELLSAATPFGARELGERFVEMMTARATREQLLSLEEHNRFPEKL